MKSMTFIFYLSAAILYFQPWLSAQMTESPDSPEAVSSPLEETELTQDFQETEDRVQDESYYQEAGKMWRQFRDREISREEYIRRIKEMNTAGEKYLQEAKKLAETENYHGQLQKLRERYRGIYRQIRQEKPGTPSKSARFSDL